MTSFSCPVCHHRHCTLAFQATDHFVSGEVFPIYSCDQCGFHMTGNLPPDDQMDQYYQSDDYISHSDTRKGLFNRIYHTVRNLMLNEKLNIVKRTTGKTTGRVLDIGAGTGYFMNFAARKGWETTGTERNSEARRFAKEHWKLELLPGDHLFDLPPASFDAISMWHVLEHLPDQDKYWKTLFRLLPEGGFLFIALPNFCSFDAVHYKEKWAAWDVPRHLWHYAPENIIRQAGNYGFRLTGMKRMPFDAFYVSILSEKYKKSQFPLMKGLFYGKISWLASLIDVKKSSSVIYIFRKQNS